MHGNKKFYKSNFYTSTEQKNFIPQLRDRIENKTERNLTNTNKQNGNFMHKEFLSDIQYTRKELVIQVYITHNIHIILFESFQPHY